VIIVNGCHYLGCEDVATAYRVIHDDDTIVDVFLCTNHDSYVSRAARTQPGQVRVLDEVSGRLRIAGGHAEARPRARPARSGRGHGCQGWCPEPSRGYALARR